MSNAIRRFIPRFISVPYGSRTVVWSSCSPLRELHFCLHLYVYVYIHSEAFPTRLAERRAIPQCRNHPLLSGTTGRQQPPAVVSAGAYSCLVQDRLHTSPSRYIALLVSIFQIANLCITRNIVLCILNVIGINKCCLDKNLSDILDQI